MSAVALMAPVDPMVMQAPIEPPRAEVQGPSEGLVSLVERLGVERTQLSEARMHQVMNQVAQAHAKREVAIQFLDQITQCTDGSGRLDVSKMNATTLQRAIDLFGDRLGEIEGVMSPQATAALRSTAESVERQLGNLEVTDQMKLQQMVQHLQREVQFFLSLSERLYRIMERAIEGIRGR
jgi:hypothetical protein